MPSACQLREARARAGWGASAGIVASPPACRRGAACGAPRALLIAGSLLVGCAGPPGPDLPAADPEAFAVPAACRADMRVDRNVLTCGRRLMTVARDFGKAATTRLEAVLQQGLAPPGKVARAEAVQGMIREACLEETPARMALYDDGQRRRAVAEGLAPLSRCVLYAGKVMDNFGAADATAALDRAVQRLTYGIHPDDPVLGPPPGYDLGPVTPGAHRRGETRYGGVA